VRFSPRLMVSLLNGGSEMRLTRHAVVALALFTIISVPCLAQLPSFKPGFNFFSKEQDIQLGKEAAAQIEKEVEIVNDKELTEYIASIGRKLAAQPQADNYPYTFKVVNDKSINAFALPGGPAYVHTGLIAAADNEAQIAGVLAHEIVHVALRHGTNQVSKANLIQLPAMFGAQVLGQGILGQLGQLGIGLGANSLLLKFSRTAETQADLLGVQIAAQAGYDPLEMARFFEKLEAEGGARGPEFLSSHPNPGNRTKAIQDLIQKLPRRQYTTDSGQLARMKARVAKLPDPKPKAAAAQPASSASSSSSAPVALSLPNSRPSGSLQQYQGKDFRLSYPANWQVSASQNSGSVTIAPPSGVQQTQNGANVGYGVIVAYHKPRTANASLWQATDELVSQLRSADPGMRAAPDMPREIKVGGKPAIFTTLYSPSVFQGQTELDRIVTVSHPNGLLYMVFIAPESERQYVDRVFDQMLQSIRFSF
jgi:Zn-dependent protease with chaperone function